MDRFKFLPKSKINDLPKTSGVYCFTEKAEDIGCPPIYIGKAINIQSRVKNHFSQPSYRDNLFMDKVDKVGFLETGSEIEALILEANLIKKYQPKFNVVWRDDKNYFYVAVAQNKNKVPYIYITHQPKSGGHRVSATFIGPFVEGAALKKTLRFLRRAFPYYTSAKHPKLKCTYCHLGLCPGPAPMENPPSDPRGTPASARLREYKKSINKLILILKGKRNKVLYSLEKEMKALSREKNFEEAAKIRDRIHHLEQVMSHTHVINANNHLTSKLTTVNSDTEILRGIIGINKEIHRIECYDVSNIQGKFATASMVVFSGKDGNFKPDKSQYKKFKIRSGDEPNDIAMLKETLQRRFVHKGWSFPEIILIDGGKAQLNVALKIVNSLKIGNWKLKIKVISIAKGRRELFVENRDEPIPLKNLPQEVYNLIKNLDDEAHRFAITYHKKLRKKSILQ